MCKMMFQLTGNMSVNGETINENGENHFVLMEGNLTSSGANHSSIARAIGLRNIAMATGAEEYLEALSPAEIRQALIEMGVFDDVMYGEVQNAA
jgi:hypothetical protein